MGRSLGSAGISQSQTHASQGARESKRQREESSAAKEEGKTSCSSLDGRNFLRGFTVSLPLSLPARSSPQATRPALPPLLTASLSPPPLSFLKLPVLPNDIWLRQHDANATKIPPFFRSPLSSPALLGDVSVSQPTSSKPSEDFKLFFTRRRRRLGHRARAAAAAAAAAAAYRRAGPVLRWSYSCILR